MIREAVKSDREELDKMQFALQRFFSEIDQTQESLPCQSISDAHKYMQKILDDAESMNGKVFISEVSGKITGFVQGVIIEHRVGDDEIYDLSHHPSKEGWIGLLYVKSEYRSRGIGQELLSEIKDYFESEHCTAIKLLVLSANAHAIKLYEKNGFRPHNLEMTYTPTR